jgi:hypothetical protein
MASTILSDNGVSSGSAGIKTSADGTGVLALQTTTSGGTATTAVSISTSQVVSVTNDATISGLTVGKGGGAVASNTAVGASALAANSSGVQISVFGTNAGAAATGNNLTAFGYNAGKAVTSGGENAAFGALSFQANTTGANCVAIGVNSLYSNTTGSTNTAVGQQSLYLNSTGSANTAVGYQAGSGQTTSTGDNVFYGYTAGNNITTGANNLYLGAYTRASSATVSNEQVVGYNLTGIGTNYFAFGSGGVGTVYNQFSTNASWTRSSDARLKKNIQNANLGLEFITKLRPVTYQWKPSNEVPQEFTNLYSKENKKDTSTVMHGLIAQEVKQALDDVGVNTFGGWHEDQDGCQGVASDMFVFPLIKAIQELKAEFDAYKATHP